MLAEIAAPVPTLPVNTLEEATPLPAQPETVPEPPVVQTAVSAEQATTTIDIGTRKWKIFTTLDLRCTYDDNIFISDDRKQSDFYFTVAPGLAFGWGDYRSHVKPQDEFDHIYEIKPWEVGEEKTNYFFASYTANWTSFVHHPSENALDHDLLVDSQWQFQKLTLGVKSRFQTLDSPDIDVGDRVHRAIFTESVDGNYWISDKTSVDVKLNDSYRDYRDQLDSNEFVDENWLNYQLFPKTNVGVGATFGYLTVQDSPSQTYEQLQLGVTWFPTDKFSVRANGGIEYRQTHSTSGNRLGGVFGLGASYLPFDGTEIGLDAYRRTENSAVFPGDNFTATGISARIKQRLFQRLYGTLLGGYISSIYDDVPGSRFAKREDDFLYVQLGLSFDFTKWSSIDISYQYRQNESTQSGPTFHQNLANVRVNILF